GDILTCYILQNYRNNKQIVKKIVVTCPTCKQGEIVERKSKKNRVFFGCERYPDCEFVSWDKPVGRNCPKCDEFLVEKRTKTQVQSKCSKCDYTEEAQT